MANAYPDCGCVVRLLDHGNVGGGVAVTGIIYCPLHEAAAEMFEALTNLVQLVENASGIHRVRMSGTLASAHYALTIASGQKALSL